MQKRKIAIFTGNRAEYGMQYPIIKAIAKDKRFKYYLLVSGAHLDEKFGRTINEIENDGFDIYAKTDIFIKGDSLFDTAQAIGKGILNISKILKKIKPNVFIVYADRFESFAAMIAGTQMGIPTAHVEGGDITEGGALDDMVRHAMGKLAHIHFTTNEQASFRLKKMGEEPWRIFTAGLPAIDLIKEGKYASSKLLERKYNISVQRPLVVCTQHSIATEFKNAIRQVRPVLSALLRLDKEGVQVIMTFPNNDAGGIRIMREIERIIKHKKSSIQVFKSLGRFDYHGLLNICGRVGRGVCVGNSSSGIKETAIFGCPVVNIGNRQKGRLRADNVIDVGYSEGQIYNAIKKCLEDENFRKKCSRCHNPYYRGGAGKKITGILAKIPLNLRLIQKKLTY